MLTTATWLVFIAFYVISLPLAYYFTFQLQWGMVGLWWGVVCGSLCEVVLYYILLKYYCDWERLAYLISETMQTRSADVSFKKGEQLYEPMTTYDNRKTSIEC